MSIDTSIIIKEYENGASLNSIQRKYNITTYMCKKILTQQGIHIRSRNEQNKYNVQNQRKYSVNDKYFSSQNKNMAYLLGFLAADGCVYKKNNIIKISLSSVDKEFLELINKELSSTFPIHDYNTKDGFDVSELRISSREIKDDLADFGIVPNKTYTFNFPEKLEEKYYIDFIRGYFDGDGSVSTAGKSLRWQICSYRKELLDKIIEILEKNNIPRVNIYKKNNTYYFQYSTNATKAIFNLIYYENCFCLPRKFNKYKNLLMK